ncbi:MAG: IS200/IS605 family transposase [Fibrobacteres bacterium]|nr:IS200/IS605 family transposase [Fibrobacterota bacterium]
MPQSLAKVYIHLVFSTKYRERCLTDNVRQPLHSYMASVLQNIDCPAVIINSVEDHIHILFKLSRVIALCKAAEEVKKSSSKWIKTQGVEFAEFSWQRGYGAFAVNERGLSTVKRYIANQRAHHSKKNFQDEYIAYLLENKIEYDERYVWD